MSETELAIVFALVVATAALGIALIGAIGLRLHIERNPNGYPHGRSAA